jgi:hypothetical protein
MKKKDQEAIAQLYTEAGAFYSGGSRTPNDPLGLGSIRMAEPGENPFSDDDDEYYHDEDLDDINDYDDSDRPSLSEDEIQSKLGEIYSKLDPLRKEADHYEQLLIDVVRKRRGVR